MLEKKKTEIIRELCGIMKTNTVKNVTRLGKKNKETVTNGKQI